MPIRVFLADDHAIVRDGLKALLESQKDIRVIGTASDGREAFEKIQALAPDIAILDISMPQLNGIETAEKILAADARTRVIILSMHGTEQHIARALRAGARGYLLKEGAGAEVADAIRNVHAGRYYVSSKISQAIVGELFKTRQVAERNPLDKLSMREREILQLLAESISIIQIAKMLSLSPKTIETYKSRLMRKLEIKDMAALVKFAIQNGLIQLD